MGQIEKLAGVLKITPEEFKEKLEKNTLTLGQIVIVSKYMGISPEQTVKLFFPHYMYNRHLIREEVANAKKQNRKTERGRNNPIFRDRKGEEGCSAECSG